MKEIKENKDAADMTAEDKRLLGSRDRTVHWKHWGPYLSERQWGTVREDYSPDGTCWDYFPHDQARSRTYRWGEDGLLGITDRQNRLCFALALWNGKDPILKERIFGLTGPEGNHGEDVKEYYYYLESTPTHSYMKGLYKYTQNEYPYAWLVEENRRRGKDQPEFELLDTGVFKDGRYFDVFVEYAKETSENILIRITIKNRALEASEIHVLPTVWFRNTWSWGRKGEGYWPKPVIQKVDKNTISAQHESLGNYFLGAENAGKTAPKWLFTENETNTQRLFNIPSIHSHVKDAFHEYVIAGKKEAVNPKELGTKAAAYYHLKVPASGEAVIQLRLRRETEESKKLSGDEFDQIFEKRIHETEEFYDAHLPKGVNKEEAFVMRQAYAGLLWSKQFFHISIRDWLEGDPTQPKPSDKRWKGRNNDWVHLYNRDVISMPDKWEYPWYAAWDLAFHMLPFSKVDGDFAKEQIILFLREWYTHPNGQIPAYEFAFSDVNPPVHAWAAWRVYKMTGPRGNRDRVFLERVFQKLLLNFTWWVNRKDPDGHNLFAGGFLGLDNIGVFDRSQPLPKGGHLEQADGTAWMAFYCVTMLSMALELAKENPAYEDMASKFFEHFVSIADAINHFGGEGLWNKADGFYYDQMHMDGHHIPLKVRSLVGIIPLLAVEILDEEVIEHLPAFVRRMNWFLENRQDLAGQISYMCSLESKGECHRLLAIPTKEQLISVLRYVLDEKEFLSDYGIRSVSKFHQDSPYVFRMDGIESSVAYVPGESNTGLFGGNSNWRGPIWFPLNYLLIESLERYHHFYGNSVKVECPTGSGRWMNLKEVATELSSRLTKIFLPDEEGKRPCHRNSDIYHEDSHWKHLLLFHEYFHGDTGQGLGASHQTGWTALVLRCFEDHARLRMQKDAHADEKEHANPLFAR